MAYRQNEHNQTVILDIGHNAVIDHPIAPKILAVADESVAPATRILVAGNAFAQISQ